MHGSKGVLTGETLQVTETLCALLGSMLCLEQATCLLARGVLQSAEVGTGVACCDIDFEAQDGPIASSVPSWLFHSRLHVTSHHTYSSGLPFTP